MHYLPKFILVSLLFFILPLLNGQEWHFDKVNYPISNNNYTIILDYYSGFVVGYNSQNRVADWVMHYVEPDADDKKVERKDRFREEGRLNPLGIRSGKADYDEPVYDRGHLAPNADLDYSRELADETFYFTNIAPQTASLNRFLWNNIEQEVRQLAKNLNITLLVYTGPIYSGNKEWLNNRVAIPTAFYKVVINPKNRETIAVYLAYNLQKISNSAPINYRATLIQIENLTKLLFNTRDKELDVLLVSDKVDNKQSSNNNGQNDIIARSGGANRQYRRGSRIKTE
jgi:endonuclease G